MLDLFKRRLLPVEDEEGQGLIEYALILILVAMVVLIALTILGPRIGNIFSNIVAGMGHIPQTGGGGLLIPFLL